MIILIMRGVSNVHAYYKNFTNAECNRLLIILASILAAMIRGEVFKINFIQLLIHYLNTILEKMALPLIHLHGISHFAVC